MVTKLAELLADDQLSCARFIQSLQVITFRVLFSIPVPMSLTYRWSNIEDKMLAAVARKILNDLALTIDVHPLCFGVVPENKGQLSLPAGVAIDGTVIENIICWNKEGNAPGAHESSVHWDSNKVRHASAFKFHLLPFFQVSKVHLLARMVSFLCQFSIIVMLIRIPF